ncbi:GNAT family N-acetyltransferase [Rhodococcus sp. NPDC058521]|uniref:GNAT family N-acetyltransferase n=1 Tax=Rhodococcus sp. NPDC058521 TaxID=3346536 RepID=UPI00365E4135
MTSMRDTGIALADGEQRDAAELLVLQRCCWVSEAIANRTLDIPALHEDLAAVRAWIDNSLVITARADGRLVGAVRGTRNENVWEIGRLMVAPDMSGRGLGRRLLETIEDRAPGECTTFSLFTGADSDRNLRMYDHAGYRRVAEQPSAVPHIRGAVTLVKARRESQRQPDG